LFSSKSYQKNETDLAIIVTPHLVRPARPGDEIKAPTDDTLPPNDTDFFLLGKMEVTREEARKLTPVTARIAVAGDRPFTGHMLDMPKGESNAAVQ
jgi:pilus assembly protein CpaC